MDNNTSCTGLWRRLGISHTQGCAQRLPCGQHLLILTCCCHLRRAIPAPWGSHPFLSSILLSLLFCLGPELPGSTVVKASWTELPGQCLGRCPHIRLEAGQAGRGHDLAGLGQGGQSSRGSCRDEAPPPPPRAHFPNVSGETELSKEKIPGWSQLCV